MNDWFSEYSIPLLALLGTIFGGAGLEFVKRWLAKGKDTQDIATELRTELRTDLTSIKAELDATEAQLTSWKDKYYEVIEQKMKVEMELTATKQENERLKAGMK